MPATLGTPKQETITLTKQVNMNKILIEEMNFYLTPGKERVVVKYRKGYEENNEVIYSENVFYVDMREAETVAFFGANLTAYNNVKELMYELIFTKEGITDGLIE